MDTNGPQVPNIKNLVAILLGIALVVSGIAFLQSEKANRQLSEQLSQAEARAKSAEAEVASLRDTLQKLTGTAAPPAPATAAPPGFPPAVSESPGTVPEADQPPSPELLAQEIKENAGLIRAQVEQAWRIPPGTPASLACVVKIELLPSGEVQNVSLVESSGNAAFDNSALAAVRKASPFPMPASAEAAARFQSFNFRFKPGR